jgi:murein DD-endopeptidase MepM/ murein hydrolase activator NlpD
MRVNSAQKVGKSVAKLAVAALLASAATGCSSDSSRFSGLFSKDELTTASIPQRPVGGAYGQAPMPRDDVRSGQAVAPVQQDYGSRNTAMNQPYPAQSGGYSSPARAASAPMAVQRNELAAPGMPSAQASAPMASRAPMAADRGQGTRQESMAQSYPGRSGGSQSLTAPTPSTARGDNLTTASTKPMSGWSSVNAPRVTLKAGETASTLSSRYGVPEKEILKANGGAVKPGQTIVIPTFGPSRNSAKTAASDIDLQNKAPAPTQQTEQKVAVLPTPTRDKAMAEPGKITPPGGKPLGGTYTVKPGDSLAKIARETGTPIDQLKAANGLTTDGVRVGQSLKVGGSSVATDPVRTASIPEKPAAQPKPAAPSPVAEAAPAKPAPQETASLSDVEKKSDVSAAAPQSTGISKYRWPVSGAVIAGYGSNVNGSRNDGIDISVPEGTPIKAAENGVVIYAGNGLKQLGNTVLVRHDDGKVTVYGHAGNINVTRGQKVTRGQTVAASGMSGDAQRPQVHFEVRKDATPVNPITFLE